MLSHVRQGTERTATIFNELGEAAQNEEIKKVLQARAFVSEKTIEKLDEAFRLLGEQPVKLTGRLHDVFLEEPPSWTCALGRRKTSPYITVRYLLHQFIGVADGYCQVRAAKITQDGKVDPNHLAVAIEERSA